MNSQQLIFTILMFILLGCQGFYTENNYARTTKPSTSLAQGFSSLNEDYVAPICSIIFAQLFEAPICNSKPHLEITLAQVPTQALGELLFNLFLYNWICHILIFLHIQVNTGEKQDTDEKDCEDHANGLPTFDREVDVNFQSYEITSVIDADSKLVVTEDALKDNSIVLHKETFKSSQDFDVNAQSYKSDSKINSTDAAKFLEVQEVIPFPNQSRLQVLHPEFQGLLNTHQNPKTLFEEMVYIANGAFV
jgi:hypothetical protein